MKSLATLFFLLFVLAPIVYAQRSPTIGLAYNYNHLINNVSVNYEKPIKKNGAVSFGLKYLINRRRPLRPAYFYKNGYSYTDLGKLGFQLHLKKRLYKNLFLIQSNDISKLAIRTDVFVINNNDLDYKYAYLKPVWSNECLIGLELRSTISKRISLTNSVALGVLLSKYETTTVYLEEDNSTVFQFFVSQTIQTVIGFDGDMVYKVCLHYSLKK